MQPKPSYPEKRPISQQKISEGSSEKESSSGSVKKSPLSRNTTIFSTSPQSTRTSPMNSPRLSPRLIVHGSRVQSEGTYPANLTLPYTPMNTPLTACNVLNLDPNNIPGINSFTKQNEDVIGK